MNNSAYAFSVVLLLLVGCSSAPTGPKRYAIEGTVTLDGQPLATGDIVFAPTTDGATATSVDVEQGKFSATKERGLSVGTYRVEIMSNQLTGKKIPGAGPDGMVDEMKQIIPERYSTISELEAVVSAGGPSPFTFELSSK
jgi:hypothetical protein